MRYPVNVETFIQAMRIEFGPNRAAEEGHRALIPLVNECYDDGLRGADGYPLDLDGELRALSSAYGKDLETLRKNQLLKPLIQWCNAAYAQGVQDAATQSLTLHKSLHNTWFSGPFWPTKNRCILWDMAVFFLIPPPNS